MIRFKKMIALAAALAISTMPGISAISTSAVYQTNVKATGEKSNIPDWVPQNFMDAMEFVNTYGNTLVKDNLACMVLKVSTSPSDFLNIKYDGNAAASIDDELIFSEEIPYDGLGYIDYDGPDELRPTVRADYQFLVNVYNVKNFSTLDVIVERGYTTDAGDNKVTSSRTYTFSKSGNNGGTVLTEEDIFNWLPDSPKEFNEFRKNNGEVSTHGKYVVFCGYDNPSTGCDLKVEQNGTAVLKNVVSLSANNIELIPREGSGNNVVMVFEATSAGNVDLSFKTVRFDDVVVEETTENITVDKKLNPIINKSDLPEWIPQDSVSAAEFAAKYGRTHVEDGLVCVVHCVADPKKWESYANTTNKFERLYEGQQLDPLFSKDFTATDEDLTYVVNVYKPEESKNLKVGRYYRGTGDISNLEYTFETDEEGNITETDIFGWLPDCMTELNDYIKANGNVTVHENYLVYCGSINLSTGYDLVLNNDGTTWFNEVDSYKLNDTKDAPPGSPDWVVKLYEAEKKGDTTVRFEYKPYSGNKKAENKLIEEKTLRVDNDLNIVEIDKKDKAPLLKGDCNYDGFVGIADVVILQEYLMGRYDYINFDNSDINSDGKINMFDLILLKRKMFDNASNYVAETEPLMAVVYENHAWGDAQSITVYDQNGKAYRARYTNNDEMESKISDEGLYTDFVEFSEDKDWYTNLKAIMTKENELGGYDRLPDGVVNETKDLMKQYDTFKDAQWGRGMAMMCDGGTKSIYVFGKNDSKPVFMELCMTGDWDSIRNDETIQDYVKTLIHEHIFNFTMDYKSLMTNLELPA